ncbi:MAG: carbon-nitrogen hydrolase family protein [Ruminococcus sp.]|nr:carbon-nitrogen hydrolase family protein [Ruminococcus sp.]
MNFKVAILQMRSESRAYIKNTETIIEKMKESAKNGADILLMPECFLTGYDLTIGNNEALGDNDDCITKLCEAAKLLNIGVVATALTKGNNAPQNSAFIIDKDGNIIMKYSKVHTCDFADEKALESGTEFKVCDFDGIKLGIMICYDREYPESARVLMLKGAEIILVPNDCGSMTPRVNAISARAYENMCGIAMANPNGFNAGKSCAFSPICWDKNGICIDNTLVIADEFTEGILYAEFDIDEIRNYREHEMMGNTFRKVKAYSELLNDEIKEPFIRKGQ